MAGNSQRRGAMRKAGTKKGQVVGSGGNRRKGLAGKGPTPRAEDRPNHAKSRARRPDATSTGRTSSSSRTGGSGSGDRGRGRTTETVAGRNSVLEALQARVPVTALYVAERIDTDPRVREIIRIAADRRLPMLESPRRELDRVTDNAVHQGVALAVPPYDYADLAELIDGVPEGATPLFVALDSVTDPRNLGAVVRSAAAFGAHGVIIPERRSAGMSAGAWKTSAGAASRLRIARVTNLARAVRDLQKAGVFVVGLAADGEVPIEEVAAATEPLCVVVGSEGDGISRVVGEACDLRVTIPMAAQVESLNAGVAAGVALYDVARRRRSAAREA